MTRYSAARQPAPVLRVPPPAGADSLHITFWSADWTPWRAFAALTRCWPTLRFDIRPNYEAT